MTEWIPKLQENLDYTKLDISTEEGFVLSRVDGNSTVHNLSQLTGLEDNQVEEILQHLVQQGALLGPDHANAVTTENGRPIPLPVQITPQLATTSPEPLATELADNFDDQATLENTPMEPMASQESGGEELVQEDGEDSEKQTRNYRKLFETELHQLPKDRRVELAKTATGADLCALCFDPEAAVIQAIFENSASSLQQARLVAAHHHNPLGLDALAKNQRYLQDSTTQRFLLRNVQTSDAILLKILAARPLLQLYQLALGRDLSERAMRNARQALRRSFQTASAEEKVTLIVKTEARCLTLLIGLSLDGKTTSLLCRKPANSTLYIQNFCRWAATPPNLIAHLFQQPLVRRTVQLRQQLLRHQNCPSQIKKGG